jgi:hypothetical protein
METGQAGLAEQPVQVDFRAAEEQVLAREGWRGLYGKGTLTGRLGVDRQFTPPPLKFPVQEVTARIVVLARDEADAIGTAKIELGVSQYDIVRTSIQPLDPSYGERLRQSPDFELVPGFRYLYSDVESAKLLVVEFQMTRQVEFRHPQPKPSEPPTDEQQPGVEPFAGEGARLVTDPNDR